MRVLGIVGSPRRGGNTETLVDEVLMGAREASAMTEKVILSELDVAPCKACNECRRGGRCAQEDDMVALLDKMRQSKAWVLGTPVYWWGPTAQFKAFIDRWYGVEREVFGGRRVILAIPLGGGSDRYARHTLGMLTDILDYLGSVQSSVLLATGAHGKGAVRSNIELMKKARDAGREAVVT
jgi:multimeric flavodoxin WrbA